MLRVGGSVALVVFLAVAFQGVSVLGSAGVPTDDLLVRTAARVESLLHASDELKINWKRYVDSSERLDVLIELDSPADAAWAPLRAFPAVPGETRAAARQRVFDTLSARHFRAQRAMRALLAEHDLDVTPFWIVNALFVRKIPLALLVEIDARPDSQIRLLSPNQARPLVTPVDFSIPRSMAEVRAMEQASTGLHHSASAAAGAAGERPPQWNLELLRVPYAWNLTRGEGVTFGNIDTGVHWKHEALQASYRGVADARRLRLSTPVHAYNWFDPHEFRNDTWWCDDWGCSPKECCLDEPFDLWNHGTHTMGTAIGSHGIGVAPGATWVAAKGCRDGACLDLGLLQSGEWMVCPKDLQHANPDCSKGVDVVSNSWGGYRGERIFADMVQAWHAAGIIPLASLGNDGPGCGTASSIGDYKAVVGVASVSQARRLSDYSARGPGPGAAAAPGAAADTPWGHWKPDLSAPGEAIVSSVRTGYDSMSGTSMAAPHVAGTVVLMLSANPQLTWAQVQEVLFAAVTTDVAEPVLGDTPCSERKWDDFTQEPAMNFHYGHGLLDTLDAVERAIRMRRTSKK